MIKLLRVSYPLQQCRRCLSKATSEEPRPVIPKRIERNSTDILRALSNTVGKDPTAAHYKYHDDPYFIPMSTAGKRTFALAQEAGRKAAKWIVNQHPELFQHKVADPPIEALVPKAVYTEESEIGEDILLKVIREDQVSDAVIIYNLLKQKGIDLAPTTYQSLLELVCFYNCEDGLPAELIEERWFTRENITNQDMKTWKDYGTAEEIFKKLESSPPAYSTIIPGMVKYGQVERAWQLYEASQEKGFDLNTNAFNALLTTPCILKQKPELRWEMVLELLRAMAKQGVPPDLNTLNSVLQVIKTMSNTKDIKQWLLSTLAEFKRLGVEPSPGSYYFVLMTLCRDRGPISHVLVDIMNELDGKELAIRHPKDVLFFSTAMEVCCKHLHDVALARRVDNLLHVGANYDLVGDSFKESLYHRYFFTLLVQTEPLEKFFETYNLLVPNVYTPEPSVMMEVLKAVDANGAMEYFPRLWSQMVIFDHSDRINLVSFLMEALVRNQPADGDALVKEYERIALEAWDKIENQPAMRTNKMSWTGELLSNVLILLTRSNNMEKARMVMNKLDKEQNTFIGDPSVEALCSYLDLCIAAKNVDQALKCLKYCSEMGLAEVTSMAKQIQSQMSLSDAQINRLDKVIQSQT